MDSWEKELRQQLGYLNSEELLNFINGTKKNKTNTNFVLAPMDGFVCKECSKKDRNFYLSIIFMLFVALGFLYNAKTDNAIGNYFTNLFKKDVVVEEVVPQKKKPAPKIESKPKVEKPKVEVKPEPKKPEAKPKPEVKAPESKISDSLKKELEEINKKIQLLNDKVFVLGIQANNNWAVNRANADKNDLIMLNRDFTLNQMPKHLSPIGEKEQKELIRLVKPSSVK